MEESRNENLGKLAEEALKAVVMNKPDCFNMGTQFNLRLVSKNVKGSVDKYVLSSIIFRLSVLKRELPSELLLNLIPEQRREWLKTIFEVLKTKDKFKLSAPHKKLFLQLMLDNLSADPAFVCGLAQFSCQINLLPEDFKKLGKNRDKISEFLTQPIKKSLEEREELLLCIDSLSEKVCTAQQCENLKESIFATYELFTGSEYLYRQKQIYRNCTNVKFSWGKLQSMKLVGVNFAKAHFYHVEFINVDFFGANFEWTIFFETKFFETNFRNVSFKGASFKGVNFKGADLEGACFVETNLEGANLCGITFADVDFNGANLEHCQIFYSDPKRNDKVIENLQKAVELSASKITPLLFSVEEQELSKLTDEQIIQLKELSKKCVDNFLKNIDSVSGFITLLSQISIENNIFCYSQGIKIKNIYSEMLEKITNRFISKCQNNELKNENEYIFKNFKIMLTNEIKKQKHFLGFFNGSWDVLQNKIFHAKRVNNNNSNDDGNSSKCLIG